ncbi:ubiquitin-activating enzyme E1, putative [Plasmodium sp. gorilla clade G2]|uniref:ubiquitin-activating enzyme E1, putative n=1 Tax=Plasmodium sp. gorilla clade G2 TaxID=880535 RepID=UPI000D201AFB|nr:ubiquitin-activating enzyme E1, putative [Plasmodium sp. gorilla clade G2]SOV18271.1 ubiquitin-activating enzyme E1, putative [Plasmodium sp. gorilla clade G2]
MQNEEYKRLISLWGVEHQEILMSNSILFLGSSLLILEICKGLVLSGVSNLTIIDNELIDIDNLRNYKLYYNLCNLNDYKCKVIEQYLIRTNRNVNINSIIANPMEYFYNILKERKEVEIYKCNDKIKTHIDILICNLNVKDNIYIEKLCNKHNINVITCNYINMIGYLNICLKENNHFYIHNNNNNNYNSFFFYHYIALSLLNIPEINEYVKKIDYTSFKHNNVINKILFLIKCYKDIYNIEQEKKNIIINKNKNNINSNNINNYYIHSGEIINCNDILLYIKNKLFLTSLSFPYIQNITHEFLTVHNILCIIKKYKIQSDIHNYHNNFSICKNHISFFLIVYKSFIKENHDLPYLYDDINFEDQNINTILMKKKQQHIQKLQNIINKKKIKYSFYKPFTITYFGYFFSHFHNIRYITKDQIKNNDELLNHWQKFMYLYEYSMDKKENKNYIYRGNTYDNNNNIYRDNTYDDNNNNNIYLDHTCNNNHNYSCSNNHYKHKIEIKKKKKKKGNPILLCNNKSNDILYFYKSKLNDHIKGKIKDGIPNILLNNNIYTMYTSIYQKKDIYFVKNLLIHSHRNTSILMNSIQNINNSFMKYNKTNNFCSNICLVLLMSGFITQEILKIASLYLKPHINYYFFEL